MKLFSDIPGPLMEVGIADTKMNTTKLAEDKYFQPLLIPTLRNWVKFDDKLAHSPDKRYIENY